MFLLQIFLSKTFQKALPFSGEIPFIILFLSRPNAPFPLPFSINFASLRDRLTLLFNCKIDANLIWIASHSKSSDLTSIFFNSCSLLSSAFKWYLPSDVWLGLLGFCRTNAGITCEAFKQILFSGVWQYQVVSVLYTYWACYWYSLKVTSTRELFLLDDNP